MNRTCFTLSPQQPSLASHSSVSLVPEKSLMQPLPPGYVPEQQPVIYTQQPGATRIYPTPNDGSAMAPQMVDNYTPAITVQPGLALPPGAVMVPLPAPIEGVPAGLEYLTMVDTIYVQQMYELLELVVNWECKNKYSLKNANGQQVYYAAEESGICERQCCGPQRGWTIHIVDNFKREAIQITRPFKCCGGCCSCLAFSDCCAQECTIESPPGTVIGTVIQRPTCCYTGFYIRDENGKDIFSIQGPCCCLLIGCQDKEFLVMNMAGEQIGAVTKKWGGCLREAFTNADVFSISFPQNLDVKLKAILLGATFLIDFMHFEQPKNNSG